jgi:CDGSH-type Zn-finger protein
MARRGLYARRRSDTVGSNSRYGFPVKGEPMDKPVVAQKAPYQVDLVAGQKYWWCVCGLSKGQPFCDGSHKVTTFVPFAFTADESKTAYMCGCKASHTQPFCDGTHRTL